MRFEESVTIDRPVNEVFAYVTDPKNLSEWDKGIHQARLTTPEPMDAGAELEIERTVPPFNQTAQFVGQVKEYDPEERFSIVVDDGRIPYGVTYSFDDDHGSTTMHVAIESRPHGLLKFLEPLTKRFVRKQIQGYYEQLRRILERNRPNGGPPK